MLIYYFKILLVLYMVGFLSCYIKTLMLKREGFTEFGPKACINPMKWVSVFIGYLFKWLVPDHVFEQLVLRMYDTQCRKECYNSSDGKCTKCGCDALAKAYSPLETCSNGNWGPIIFSKSKYKKLRGEHPATITIEYGKQEIL